MSEKTLHELLDAPIDSELVSKRDQAGKTFSYLESWAVLHEMNQIFGHTGWASNIEEIKLVLNETFTNEKDGRTGYRVAYTAQVTVNILSEEGGTKHFHAGCYHTDVGYGDGTSYEHAGKAHESAIKEAVSDASKRAIRHLGGRMGLYLYDKSQKNVIDYSKQAKQLLNVAALRIKEGKLQGDISEIEKNMMRKPTGREAFEYMKQVTEGVSK